MTMPDNAPPFTWEITGYSPGEYGPGPGGSDVPGRMVYFTVSGIQHDQVFVPDAQWGVDQVNTVVARAARTAYDIRYSSGPAAG